MSLDQCDRLIQGAAAKLGHAHAIVCLHTGARPAFCEPMLRDPVPALGWRLSDLAAEFRKAKEINAAVEDGALMFGRETVAEPYRATGWSYRLYPPSSVVAAVVNRGSAFNSCLLMSQSPGVDALYQLADGNAWRFRLGVAAPL